MGAKYKKDDKCMPDNYVGVFHERAAKVHRFVPRGHKEMLFIVEVPFLVDVGSDFALWGKP